jgi:branched-chain amino acid transport system ATP-binding protein
MLELRNVDAGYARTTVLHRVSWTISAGEVVALLGRNGAGKTTLLRTIAGGRRPSTGSVAFDGRDITRWTIARRAAAGICHIPERAVFGPLTVREHLRLFAGSGRWAERDRLVAAFPWLHERGDQPASTLSGGEQQLLALTRAMLQRPRLVLVDEASLGLSPPAVDAVYGALAELVAGGVALVVVEQYVGRALTFADRAVVLQRGCIVYDGPTANLDRDSLTAHYLGGVAS